MKKTKRLGSDPLEWIQSTRSEPTDGKVARSAAPASALEAPAEASEAAGLGGETRTPEPRKSVDDRSLPDNDPGWVERPVRFRRALIDEISRRPNLASRSLEQVVDEAVERFLTANQEVEPIGSPVGPEPETALEKRAAERAPSREIETASASSEWVDVTPLARRSGFQTAARISFDLWFRWIGISTPGEAATDTRVIQFFDRLREAARSSRDSRLQLALDGVGGEGGTLAIEACIGPNSSGEPVISILPRS